LAFNIPPTLALDDTFTFGCHPDVACFNHCCRDLNQALTPYDVLRLKDHLNISSQELIQRYMAIHTGEATGLPVATLRFSSDASKNCPFVTAQGCRVYSARPSSCRIYPLARALQRSRRDGGLREHFVLIQESHCRGFETSRPITVRRWIASQELEAYHKFNDMMLELIALKNQLRPGPLSGEHRQLAEMAFYDLDTVEQKARAGLLPATGYAHLTPLPDHRHEAWLAWSLAWIGQVLFGKRLDFLSQI
jgi:Fe-S-cluster containining protein